MDQIMMGFLSFSALWNSLCFLRASSNCLADPGLGVVTFISQTLSGPCAQVRDVHKSSNPAQNNPCIFMLAPPPVFDMGAYDGSLAERLYGKISTTARLQNGA